MSQYSALTVAQLKDALKEKDLPTDGKKADLVARLTATETNTQELNSEEVPQGDAASTEVPQNELIETETAETGENSAPVEESDVQTAGIESEQPKKPEPKVLTPEEKKQLAVELLTKKIQRAEKFGDEAQASAARKDLARVEKFGLDPSTALGKEINGLSSEVNSELGIRQNRRNQKQNKNNRNIKKNKNNKVSKK